MFTGIIEEVGTVRKIGGGTLAIDATKVIEDVHLGDSIAVNGVCLTVTSFDREHFEADVMPETLRRSNLGMLKSGDQVNLERAMAADGRFGGHIVSGHIDGTGIIRSMQRDENAVWVRIETGQGILKYIVEKGSITIDGISLTVAAVTARDFSVSIIPHTGAETTLLTRREGDTVNLETDILAKYTEKLLGLAGAGSSSSGSSGGTEASGAETEDSGGITTDMLASLA